MAGAMLAIEAAASRLEAISFRNAVLHCAASSNVRGGESLVFVRPGYDAFAITAIPQTGTLPPDAIRKPRLQKPTSIYTRRKNAFVDDLAPSRARVPRLNDLTKISAQIMAFREIISRT